jgi:hypothetical protein
LQYSPNGGVEGRTLTLPVGAAIGARISDVLATAGWSVAPSRSNDGSYNVGFWGHAYAAVDMVLRRRLFLEGRVDVLEAGASAGARAELYFGRRLGVWLSVRGGSAVPSPSTVSFVDAGAGVIAWLSPRAAVTVSYEPGWSRREETSGYYPYAQDVIAHQLTLGLVARP